jgi:COMPASS component SPP1
MINCESCNDWFHGTCVSLEEADEELIETYICSGCEEQGKGKTIWVRKCRLDGCKKPAIPAVKGTKGIKGTNGSKYCSDEHGVQFFRLKLGGLDPDSITRQQLKALLDAVVGVDEFKVLGEEEPTIPEETLLKYKTVDDDSQFADLQLEREKILRKLEIVELRRTYLQLAVEKAKQLNLDLKNSLPQQLTVGKNKQKAKEICGFDERLLLDDAEFLEWSATEDGKRIFSELRIDGDQECQVEKRRCRHNGWQGLRGEDILMDESLLRGQLDGISRKEKMIKYISVEVNTNFRDRQKVRARNASPSNGHAIPLS